MDVRFVFRRGNLLIARAAREASDEPIDFICECANEDCLEKLTMTPEDFERETAAQGHFVVLEGHEDEDAEIAGGGFGYSVVRDWHTGARRRARRVRPLEAR
jgi:hypothetical protein